MAAPNIDITKPAYGAGGGFAVDGHLDQLRDNIVWLMIAAASNNYMLPGWTTVVNGSADEPNYIALEQGLIEMRYVFTWTDSRPTTIVYQYDKGLGAGLETLMGGTFDISYDGDGNITGVTTS